MSTFGDGTFKQEIYDEILYKMTSYEKTKVETIQDLLDIVQWLMYDVEDKAQ